MKITIFKKWLFKIYKIKENFYFSIEEIKNFILYIYIILFHSEEITLSGIKRRPWSGPNRVDFTLIMFSGAFSTFLPGVALIRNTVSYQFETSWSKPDDNFYTSSLFMSKIATYNYCLTIVSFSEITEKIGLSNLEVMSLKYQTDSLES